MLIADDAGTIADQIVALLTDAGMRERIGQAGRELVRSRFSWDAVAQRVQAIDDALDFRVTWE